MRVVAVAALIVAALLLSAGAASAVVPPRDCGMQKVSGKRYQIKADQLRCRTAKTHSLRYLSSGRRPSGYRCRNYSRSTKLRFRCAKGVRVFFAIRR